MNLRQLLEQQSESILAEAQKLVDSSRLEHYQASGAEATRLRLDALYHLTVRSVSERNLAPSLEHADKVARERFNAGFDLAELQRAYNVLEEVIWRRIIAGLEPSELAEALGLVGTVLGAAKDRLARTYVSLVSQNPAPSLNLEQLFRGRAEGY